MILPFSADPWHHVISFLLFHETQILSTVCVEAAALFSTHWSHLDRDLSLRISTDGELSHFKRMSMRHRVVELEMHLNVFDKLPDWVFWQLPRLRLLRISLPSVCPDTFSMIEKRPFYKRACALLQGVNYNPILKDIVVDARFGKIAPSCIRASAMTDVIRETVGGRLRYIGPTVLKFKERYPQKRRIRLKK